MITFKKVFAGLATAAVMTTASAGVVVGGVSWDPDYAEGASKDFMSGFDFTQWYSSTPSGAGTIASNSFTSRINFGTINTDLNNGGSFGNYWLQGVGQITSINNNSDFVSPTDELLLAFGGIRLTAAGALDATNGWFSVFRNTTTPNFTVPVSNDTEVQAALTGNTWLSGTITSAGFAFGGTAGGGYVSASLLVTGGDAEANFKPKTLDYIASAFFFDVTQPGVFFNESAGGSGSLRGNTIPEPTSIALMGLALAGVGAIARRRKQA